MSPANPSTIEAEPPQSSPPDTTANEVSSIDPSTVEAEPPQSSPPDTTANEKILVQREVQITPDRPKRRRSSVASSTTDETSDSESDTPTPEATPAPKKRTRGPSKKPKLQSPACEERFLSIYEPLRRETSRPLEVSMALDAHKLCKAFEHETPRDVPIDTKGSLLDRIRQRIEFCDTMIERGNGMVIRGIVQQRFELVNLFYEYRKATENLSKGAERKARSAFLAELFPGKDPSKTQWKYYRQVGEPLLRLVERYGWGALIFPGLNMTKKSLQNVRRGVIEDFLDYVGVCHPGLAKMVKNLSHILPRLIRWGLPPGGLGPGALPAEQVTHADQDIFNRLFPLPACIQPVDGEPPGPGMDILNWPSPSASVQVSNDTEVQPEDSAIDLATVSPQALSDLFFDPFSTDPGWNWELTTWPVQSHCNGLEVLPSCKPPSDMDSAGVDFGDTVLNTNSDDAVADIANSFGPTTVDKEMEAFFNNEPVADDTTS
ncbi:hypothetical protein HIM_09848 [Hirsutella minnesotensis 3608]|uniref:Uncharacterized protein n=1 Tax=Hirsutella minnesotensis 3608 TaxID=1043627 RepID=A0A0F8A2W0_9HYPO|nr:hypothetical protein HIM_09848 [Hirsutella minnesotensis 3608]